jgi:hypothetical protein
MKKLIFLILFMMIFINLYALFFFKPKKFYINNIEIKAPKNTYISDVSINEENKYNIFSFWSIKKHTLKKDEDITIIFMGIEKKSVSSLSISVQEEEYFYTFIKNWSKSYNSTLTKNNQCFIYKYQDGILHNSMLYKIPYNLFIVINATNENINNEIIHNFCDKTR